MTWFAWLAQAVAVPSPPSAGDSNPISVAYSWAQLLALLTDRALWLFFLGIILWAAWYIMRKKDAVIAANEAKLEEHTQWEREEIQKLANIVRDNTNCMNSVRSVLERIDRKL